MSRHSRSAQSGFSLIEALMTMVLMGLVLVTLSSITAQWLPNWNRGFASVQNQEVLQRGLERVLADLSAAEYIPLTGDDAPPLFIGAEESVTFVRRSLGPNTRPGLEIIRLEEKTYQREAVLVRTRTRFTPATAGTNTDSLPPFGDAVVVMRAPYRLTFSYAGNDRVWRATWQNADHLPRAIRLLVHNTVTGQTLPVSTIAMIHVDAPPPRQQGNKPSQANGSSVETQLGNTTFTQGPQ